MLDTSVTISAYTCVSVVDKDNRIMARDVDCGVWCVEWCIVGPGSGSQQCISSRFFSFLQHRRRSWWQEQLIICCYCTYKWFCGCFCCTFLCLCYAVYQTLACAGPMDWPIWTDRHRATAYMPYMRWPGLLVYIGQSICPSQANFVSDALNRALHKQCLFAVFMPKICWHSNIKGRQMYMEREKFAALDK